MSDLAEEILFLVGKRSKIGTGEIQDRLNLTKETTTTVINFLMEFGFVQLDENKRYITLSAPCRKFYEETVNDDQDRDERLTLAIAYL